MTADHASALDELLDGMRLDRAATTDALLAEADAYTWTRLVEAGASLSQPFCRGMLAGLALDRAVRAGERRMLLLGLTGLIDGTGPIVT